jgi:hypothetical protein
MTTETEKEVLKPDMTQLDSTEVDPLCRVLRSFFLKVVDGPHQLAAAGMIVRLTKENALGLFYSNRIEPVGVLPVAEYEAIDNFRLVEDGKYVQIEKGDLLEFAWSEALPLLLKQQIKPKNFQLFGG